MFIRNSRSPVSTSHLLNKIEHTNCFIRLNLNWFLFVCAHPYITAIVLYILLLLLLWSKWVLIFTHSLVLLRFRHYFSHLLPPFFISIHPTHILYSTKRFTLCSRWIGTFIQCKSSLARRRRHRRYYSIHNKTNVTLLQTFKCIHEHKLVKNRYWFVLWLLFSSRGQECSGKLGI